MRFFLIPLLMVFSILGLNGCSGFSRLAYVGQEPPLTQAVNPKTLPDYRPVSMPMPTPLPSGPTHANSLWKTGAKAFFKDQRASRIGDILTVLVNINDSANLSNKTERSRQATEKSTLNNFITIETNPQVHGIKSGNLVGLSTNPSTNGEGKAERSESINLTIPATVIQILPNGNLVVMGRQEVRVNFETRDLVVSGIVRSSDVTAANTIKYSQMAEARIGYGGRGTITEFQQPAWGQQIVNILSPF